MSEPDERLQIARQWLAKAENDLRNAEHTLTLPDAECPFDTVCFHAQQCAEKHVKALLTFLSIRFPRTHDLGELIGLLPEPGAVPLSTQDQEMLTDLATVARYPGEPEPLSRTDAEDALRAAMIVRSAVRPAVPAERC